MTCTEYLKNKYIANEINQKRQVEINTWKWLVLLGCFLLQMIPYCITLNLNNVFVGSDWNTWVQGQNIYIGIAFTLGSLISSILSPIVARLFNKRINYKLVYSLGIITALIGFMGPGIISIITKQDNQIPSLGIVIPILWISIILAQLGAMIFSGIGINNLISKWWSAEKRGFALGIAFAGGSLGIIWLKQLLSFLANNFGNITPNKTTIYPLNGNQYATYFILGAIGLILGLIIVLFLCKKPLPPNITDTSKLKQDNKVVSNNNDVSPLETRKYPVYWLLAIGFLFIQMGTIHASMNGLIIANTTVVANHNLNYNDIMGIGGSIFGVCCIIGNVSSGFLNEKLKPSKSILLAGIIQCISIFCLMYSTVNSNFSYLYFVLAGLSVYIYTTMPAYISGRLYGPSYSNNHLSILSIFLAIGFAIINSISGLITGPTGFNEFYEIRNPHMLFNITVAGNFLALELFSIISMLIGTIVASICSAIIQTKNIKGLKEYNPSKFTYIITFRYGLAIKFWYILSYLLKKDISDFKYFNKKINSKDKKDKYYDIYNKFENHTIDYLKQYNKKLTLNEMRIISNIYFYSIVDKKWIQEHEKKRLNFNQSIDNLLSLNLVRIKKDTDEKIYYALNKEFSKEIDLVNKSLRLQYPKVDKEINNLIKQINRIKNKYRTKINKLNNELNNIDEKYHSNNYLTSNKIINFANRKIKKLNQKRDKKIIKKSSIWKQYLLDYDFSQKIYQYKKIESKLTNKKASLINIINHKINKYIFLETLYKFQKIKGHCLYLEFIDNKNNVYKYLINKKIENKINIKMNEYQQKINKNNQKLNKISNFNF